MSNDASRFVCCYFFTIFLAYLSHEACGFMLVYVTLFHDVYVQ